VRKTLLEAHPWLASALMKGFGKAKDIALARLTDTSATKVTLPFVDSHLLAARLLMGYDFWSYGFEPNEPTIDKFLERHHLEGLSSRRLRARELFHPASLESFKI
jgi:4,5-dihydroxyphthalate decarboxylase